MPTFGTTSSRNGGFTLVETLVTVVIMATCLVLVLRAFQTSLIALSGARDSLRADVLMTEKLAWVQSMAMDPDGDDISGMAGEFRDDSGLFSGRISMDAVDSVPGASLFRVSILLRHTVTRREYGVSTLVAEPAEKNK